MECCTFELSNYFNARAAARISGGLFLSPYGTFLPFKIRLVYTVPGKPVTTRASKLFDSGIRRAVFVLPTNVEQRNAIQQSNSGGSSLHDRTKKGSQSQFETPNQTAQGIVFRSNAGRNGRDKAGCISASERYKRVGAHSFQVTHTH